MYELEVEIRVRPLRLVDASGLYCLRRQVATISSLFSSPVPSRPYSDLLVFVFSCLRENELLSIFCLIFNSIHFKS